jgi:uncharacterized phage protein (TIGR01671 family)
MSREIKFRAWDKRLEWMFPVVSFNDEQVFEKDEWHERKDCALMQYIGLTDKNGVEIYEGDIVKAFLDCFAEVKFGEYSVEGGDYYSNQTTAGFYIDYKTGRMKGDTSRIDNDECEVIGNTYENPELLKDTK